MSIYFAIELSLREISFVVYVHALMTQKPCAVGMRNAILRNHLKLEALSWKVLDSRDTFNVVPFEDLGARMGL